MRMIMSVREREKYICEHHQNQRMNVLILLIGFSILIAGVFLAAFVWSVKKGQYDDDYSPSVRMLFDDKPKNKRDSTIKPKQS